MSSYTSEKGSKTGHASDQSSENPDAIINPDKCTGDKPTCADHFPDQKRRSSPKRKNPLQITSASLPSENLVAYPKKYGAIFAQLAIKEQMVNEEGKEKQQREEDMRKVEEKMKKVLDMGEKRRVLEEDHDDDDDEWEDIEFSEDEEMVG